jgi:hypothetical protein
VKRIPLNTKEKSDKLLLASEVVICIFSTILLIGADSGLTIEIILSAETIFPKPILISCIINTYLLITNLDFIENL